MEVLIRVVAEVDAAAASAVAHASFVQLACADWGPSAQQWFLAESAPEKMANKLRNSAYAAGAFARERMVGFLLMSVPSVLDMLFVHPELLRQGIARKLWESARAHIEARFPSVKTVELNTTPYALEFYRTVGFVPISAEFNRNGARATRMACWLPARALGAELSNKGTER